MKAVVYEKFGPPDVLELKDVQKPVAKDYEILLKIHAAAVVTEDPGLRASSGFNGILKPRKKILGQEYAGEIEKVGRKVTKFKPGEKVYGETVFGMGAYAEYICISENGALAKIPPNISYEEAAAIPNGYLTALPFLKEKGKISQSQNVLIYGASGAVGTAAVQLAKQYGAYVTGICSTSNLDLVKSLGAEKVIDYTVEDFTATGNKYDIIFDTVGKISYNQCKHLLNAKGIFLTTVPKPSVLFQIFIANYFRSRKVKSMAAGMKSAGKKAAYLNELNTILENGSIKGVIDRTFMLEEMPDAHRYVEAGHKKGNVVITINHNNKI